MRINAAHWRTVGAIKEGSDLAEPSLEVPVGLISRGPSSHSQSPVNPAVNFQGAGSLNQARTVRVRGDSMRPCTT